MQNIATTTIPMPNYMYAVCQGYYDDLVTFSASLHSSRQLRRRGLLIVRAILEMCKCRIVTVSKHCVFVFKYNAYLITVIHKQSLMHSAQLSRSPGRITEPELPSLFLSRTWFSPKLLWHVSGSFWSLHLYL